LGRCCVTSMELALLIGLLIGQLALIILAQFKLTQIATTRVVMEVKSLDSSMVEIVENIMSGGIQVEGAQMNPFQQVIAQYIMKRIESMPQEVAVVTPVQDQESGRFVKKSE
jgi:hypothetical protein